jgi:hypothetical protein
MRALRRAIEAGGKSSLGTLTAGLASSVQAAAALEPAFAAQLSPLELRRAGRVMSNLRAAEYEPAEARTVVHACFGKPTEEELHAAFAIFDVDGQGSLDADEFRQRRCRCNHPTHTQAATPRTPAVILCTPASALCIPACNPTCTEAATECTCPGEMLPLLCGEHLAFERVEDLFEQA